MPIGLDVADLIIFILKNGEKFPTNYNFVVLFFISDKQFAQQ